jgi:hypothetical protein
MFSPDPDLDFFTHPGSRIQGSKRHRIPDPDPQHFLKLLKHLATKIHKQTKKIFIY